MELHLEPWRDLYVMLGTSSAALLGLLYVVTSLHLDEITNNRIYRTRAYTNSLYLIITLVDAVLILTPQPAMALGAELVAINLLGMAINLRNTLRFTVDPKLRSRGGFSFKRVANFQGGFLLGIAAGIGLMKGWYPGLYLATASYVVLFIGVALNTWSIMLGVGQLDVGINVEQQKRD